MIWTFIGPFVLFSNSNLNAHLVKNDLELHWTISFIFKFKFNEKSNAKRSGVPLEQFLHPLIHIQLDIDWKMIWSSTGPLPLSSNSNLIGNLTENGLEIHSKNSFVF